MLREELVTFATALEGWKLGVMVLGGLLAYRMYWTWKMRLSVPSVGVPRGPLGSWRAAITWVLGSETFLRAGFSTYGPLGRPFKVSALQRWYLCITSPASIKELRALDDVPGVFSLLEAIKDITQLEHTVHPDIIKDPYHIDIIKHKMTNRLTTILPAIVEEIVDTFEGNTDIGEEWGAVDYAKVLERCIMRTTNRMFVGTPLCRNQALLDDIMEYINKTSVAGEIISLFPAVLRPVVKKCVISTNKVLQRIIDVIAPEFERRLLRIREEGDAWTDRPDDLIQWIIAYCPPHSTTRDMCWRVLAMNFAAIHTSLLAAKHLLLDLASAPDLHAELRAELDTVIARHGWTKQGLSMLKKLDSVLRESQRLNSITITALWRKALVDYTFADGTQVPAGTIVIVPSSAIHHSPLHYDAPEVFDGLKWARLRENEALRSSYQVVKTADDYLPFGHGKHACPGRFFAANELKVLMAYVLGKYEVRLGAGGRGTNVYFSLFACVPDEKAVVEFRKRPEGELEAVRGVFADSKDRVG